MEAEGIAETKLHRIQVQHSAGPFYEGKGAGVEAGLMGRGSSANATTVAPESCRVLMRLLLAFEQPARRAAMSMSGNSRIICLSLIILDRGQHCAGPFLMGERMRALSVPDV